MTEGLNNEQPRDVSLPCNARGLIKLMDKSFSFTAECMMVSMALLIQQACLPYNAAFVGTLASLM